VRGGGVALALGASLAIGCTTTAADVPRLEREAREAVEAGRIDDALGALRRAAEVAPEDAEVFFMLGVVALRAGRLDEAETALARAVALAPHDPRPLAAHGLALRGLGRYEEAESALLRSLNLRPADPSTLAALGEVYRLWGDPEKCAARYEQFVWRIEQEEHAAEDADRERALAEARSRMQECAAAAANRGEPEAR
jgi:Flp pilus assembly protein TadD